MAGQPYDPPDRGEPGDAMIQAYLAHRATEYEQFDRMRARSASDWNSRRPELKAEYLYMLGLEPVPERTPLKATVTGALDGDGYRVEKLHYQSIPGLYVTANVYRPSQDDSGARRPAVLYLCGHSSRGRNGNKTAFQSHGIWLARHGYVCLVVDSLQLGEIAGVHHGTYREHRWWWHSRGYTPAGVECWNGVRGIDYLISRPDVDPERIGVTGISGGGAATFWVAAADDRIKVAVPVSGMADLSSYVGDRVVNGHCDCMFLYNTFQWPWTQIADLIAPRPMLFVNSDADRIFPMDANERVIARLERFYSLFGAGERVDALVSVGGHDYRKDIRQAAFRFLNQHLKGDARPIDDSEVDLVIESRERTQHPIEPEKLRVFPRDSDIPEAQKNTTIDQTFVSMAKVDPPGKDGYEAWRARLLKELRRVTFHGFPERIPPARLAKTQQRRDGLLLETEDGILVVAQRLAAPADESQVKRLVFVVASDDGKPASGSGWEEIRQNGDAVYLCRPRGGGLTAWTRKDPPNYVARAHALLGTTVDAGRVWDIVAAARYLRLHGEAPLPVVVAGDGAAGLLAAYAALLEPEIGAVHLARSPRSHMDDGAPALLNVLRVLDVPDALGMLAPRKLWLRGIDDAVWSKVSAAYASAGANAQLERAEK
jgi:dienelactone hydrolase